jgi:hypothetical protein
MSKSVMQELIDELESINSYPMMPLILRLMKDRLEREKEQILNDYMEGVNAGVLYSNGKVFISKEEYYNRTYTQDRELGKEITDLLENYKKDKTFKQKSKWI